MEGDKEEWGESKEVVQRNRERVFWELVIWPSPCRVSSCHSVLIDVHFLQLGGETKGSWWYKLHVEINCLNSLQRPRIIFSFLSFFVFPSDRMYKISGSSSVSDWTQCSKCRLSQLSCLIISCFLGRTRKLKQEESNIMQLSLRLILSLWHLWLRVRSFSFELQTLPF